MQEVTQNEFYQMNSALMSKDLSIRTRSELFRYWKRRVLDRIEYLEPLVFELMDKEIELHSISSSLFDEWKELNDCNRYYEFGKYDFYKTEWECSKCHRKCFEECKSAKECSCPNESELLKYNQ